MGANQSQSQPIKSFFKFPRKESADKDNNANLSLPNLDETVQEISASDRKQNFSVSTQDESHSGFKKHQTAKQYKALYDLDNKQQQQIFAKIQEVNEPQDFPEVVKKTLSKFPQEQVPILHNYEFQDRITKALNHHGFDKKNTILSNSFCPDELNNLKGGLNDHLLKNWGVQFTMGGLSGIPFIGKGGFNAFASHAPGDNGNLLIVFGPHVGITKQGVVGKYSRSWQNGHETPTCGAALGVLGLLKSGGEVPEPDDNIQLQWMLNKCKPFKDRILDAENQEMEITMVLYEVVEQQMLKIINTEFGHGKVALIGGVLINYDGEDLFLPKHFQIQQQGKQTIDVLEELKEQEHNKKGNNKLTKFEQHDYQTSPLKKKEKDFVFEEQEEQKEDTEWDHYQSTQL